MRKLFQIFLLPGLAAPLLASNTSTPIAPNATFVYNMAVDITHGDPIRRQITVRIASVFDGGYAADLTIVQHGKKPVTHEVKADANGWTYSDDPIEKPHDVLGPDPATLCAPPPNVAEGTRWSCTVQGAAGLWPAGAVTETATHVSDGDLVLKADGDAAPVSRTYVDDQSGKPVQTTTHTTWTTVASFHDGILSSEKTQRRDVIHVGNQDLPVDFSIRLTRQ